MPTAQRISCVLNPCFSENGLLAVHDAPAFFVVAGGRYARNFKNPAAVSLAFEHRCYRRLTTMDGGSAPSRADQHVIGQHRRQPEHGGPQAERRDQQHILHSPGSRGHAG